MWRSTLLFALVLSACSPANLPDTDGGASSDAGAAGPLEASEYCEHIEPFFCDFYVRCARMAGVTTVQECRTIFQEQCNARYEPRYIALADASLLELRAEGVAACRAHLEAVSCEEQVRDLDGPCAGLWLGKQPAGGACGLDVESLVCSPGSACALGLDFCGECRPLAAAGAPCGAASEGEVTCGADASCEDGRCVARLAIGAACTPEDRCVVGARCEGGVCVGPRYVGPGESCDQVNRCRYKSHCEAGVCVEDAMLEESCAATECASGWCGPQTTCQALLDDGTPCASSSQCRSGLCLSGQCRGLPGPCFD